MTAELSEPSVTRDAACEQENKENILVILVTRMVSSFSCSRAAGLVKVHCMWQTMASSLAPLAAGTASSAELAKRVSCAWKSNADSKRQPSMHVGSERATDNHTSHYMSVCKTSLVSGKGKPVVLTQWVNINDYIASKRKEQLTMV